MGRYTSATQDAARGRHRGGRDVAAMRFAFAETEREIDAVRRLAIVWLRDFPADETLRAEAGVGSRDDALMAC